MGAVPGTLQPSLDARPSVVRVMAYSVGKLEEREIEDIETLPQIVSDHSVTWIDVAGLGDGSLVKRLGELFGLHPLALEDIVHVHQRAKVEPYEDSLFVITRLPQWIDSHFESEQFSIFVVGSVVLTFQEKPGDWFEPIRQRIRKSLGRTRVVARDYLVYTLLDIVIDSYFPIVDRLGDDLEEIEAKLSTGRSHDVLSEVHALLHELLLVRRTLRPHRDAINELLRDLSDLIDDETQVFFRDCADHTVQLIELLEVYREMCADYRDFHLSLISNRMNQVMWRLTLIATVFMPLNFIAAVYGMNFDTGSPFNMPELRWKYGYFFALGLMALVATLTLFWFSRRGWLVNRLEERREEKLEAANNREMVDP